jgi:4-hydroxythreonine-4-phosphate dehydrogenase
VLGDPRNAYTPGEPDREGALLALASLAGAGAAVAGEARRSSRPIAKARLAEVGFAHPARPNLAAAAGVAPKMR